MIDIFLAVMSLCDMQNVWSEPQADLCTNINGLKCLIDEFRSETRKFTERTKTTGQIDLCVCVYVWEMGEVGTLKYGLGQTG